MNLAHFCGQRGCMRGPLHLLFVSVFVFVVVRFLCFVFAHSGFCRFGYLLRGCLRGSVTLASFPFAPPLFGLRGCLRGPSGVLDWISSGCAAACAATEILSWCVPLSYIIFYIYMFGSMFVL